MIKRGGFLWLLFYFLNSIAINREYVLISPTPLFNHLFPISSLLEQMCFAFLLLPAQAVFLVLMQV